MPSGSDHKTVRVWDVASSTEVLRYEAGTWDQKIEFSDDSMKIIVNGDLVSVPSQTGVASAAAGSPRLPLRSPFSQLRIRGEWVTWSSERILWLHPEYRHGRWASRGMKIVIGSGTGRFTLVRCVGIRSSF